MDRVVEAVDGSRVDGWYLADGIFESIVGDDRWQLLWVGGGGVDRWQNPNDAGWSLPILSPCSTRSGAPDRVLLSVSGPFGDDEDAWVGAIEATLRTIAQKIPSARQIILQAVVGGPGHAACPCVGNCRTDRVRASWQHKHIDDAIARVVAARTGALPQIVAGFSPEVQSCAGYRDGLGHLTPQAAAAAGRSIGEYYAARKCAELPGRARANRGVALVAHATLTLRVKTSPMPPAPIGARISKGPMRVPLSSGMNLRQGVGTGGGPEGK